MFGGMVFSIKGCDPGETFAVRRIGKGGIRIERIFPLRLPTIEKIVVVTRRVGRVRRAKLYYTRTKPPIEVEMIYRILNLYIVIWILPTRNR